MAMVSPMTAFFPAAAVSLVLNLLLGALGSLLLVSGLGKAFAQRDFLGTVAAYRLLPMRTPYWGYALLAWSVTSAELFIAAGLIFGSMRAALAAAVLFLIFTLAVGINLLRGRRDIDCGCSVGPVGERLSWRVAARAFGLCLLAFLLWAIAAPSGGEWLVSRAAGLLLWLVVLAWISLKTLSIRTEAG